ncbi:MAG: hypothetical protein RLZZ428_770 [Pseudomonadota bacterium]
MLSLHMNNFRQLAIIGPTASGKTSLAIELAQHYNATILSLDSLSIYKEIDIASAKPTVKERAGIDHFGIDVLTPNESFDVTTFIKLYHHALQHCKENEKNLIIVGGTGFYLKMLIDGISQLPSISEETKKQRETYLKDLKSTYTWLETLDPSYLSHIDANDPYRIEKALDIYLETGLIPSEYFKIHPPKPTIVDPLPIYQIEIPKETLRNRIALRTNLMLKEGLIDEVCMLEAKYTRAPHAMKSIGIKETLAYLDGIYTRKLLEEKIITNTARLAKRQTTFNQSQFENVTKGSVKALESMLLR